MIEKFTQEDVKKLKKEVDEAMLAAGKSSGMRFSTPLMVLTDSKDRRINYFENSSGHISIQFFLSPKDPGYTVVKMIAKKFQDFIPKNIQFDVSYVGLHNSVCVHFPPQPINIGFKTFLKKELKNMVEGSSRNKREITKF